MTNVSAPPLSDEVVDSNIKAKVSWAQFFENLFIGDVGSVWTPSIVSLTGNATLSGKYYRLSQSLYYFSIVVTPDGSTDATTGTTYITGFPLNVNAPGMVGTLLGTAGGVGVIRSSDGRIYPQGWSGVTDPIAIVGLVEAS